MYIDIIGKINDSALFTCKNLFGLFSELGNYFQKYAELGKLSSYILSSSA